MLFSGCKKKLNDYPIVKIHPKDLAIDAYTNDKVIFTIDVTSDHIINYFLITRKYEGEQEIKVFDTTVNIKNLQFQWAYNTPAEEEDDIILYFIAQNVNGFETKVGRRLVFQGQRLEEYTGQKIYNVNGGGNSALDLVTLTPLTTAADSSVRDIQEYQSDTTNNNLSGSWISPSGCEFVKFNGFDYANASSSTAKAAFEAGNKLNAVSNIEVGDIFIIRINRLLPDEMYTVVKVNYLIEQDGRENDYYDLSVKK